METLQDFIDARKNLTAFYATRLIALLTTHSKKEHKEKIRQLVYNKFYSSFDGQEFSKKILIGNDKVIYHSGVKPEEIRLIRERLLEEL